MASKPVPGCATFKHQGRTITVKMIDPKVGADGRINPNWRNYIYRIPMTRRGAVVDVVGTITHATYTVDGWRHPIKIITSAIFVPPIVITHIEIGDPKLIGSAKALLQGEIDLDGLPLTKIKNAAIQAGTFTAKVKSRTANKIGKLTSTARYLQIKELDQPLTDIRIGGRLNTADQIVFNRDIEAENPRLMLPIDDPRSLEQIAKLYNEYYKIGRDALGYVSCVKYLSQQTNRPENTCQQMIAMCRKQKRLTKPTKRKRGKK